MMKVSSCTLVASVVAASTAALSSSSSSSSSSFSFHPDGNVQQMKGLKGGETRSALEKEKFVPRFDGLRFIETLVTAHR